MARCARCRPARACCRPALPGSTATSSAATWSRCTTGRAGSWARGLGAQPRRRTRDDEAAKAAGMSSGLQDRLRLDETRIEGMARGLDDVAALPDPVGAEIERWQRPNGLAISRVRVPIGIIGVIYEARPNVTADAGALCIKSGNVVVLRGGSDSFHSSRCIVDLLRQALMGAG